MAKYDSLNETLNTDYDKSGEIQVSPQPSIQKSQGDIDIEKDYKYTRGQLYSIIEKGQEAINGILELAQESEMPRAYEVAGQLIKNVADATDKLMDLQKKLKDVNEEKEAKGPTTVNNSLFVGSTAELQKFLKQNDKT
ncbi:terminase small subunit [Prochlorococcus phage P-TIM68]|uniref:Putative terminase DNA packaging enzyme small subunit n=1 Tax=Prochlorococcus phage P-TIM68 TaxID=1542477 RepID=A0A0K0KVG4_9CAUD|nr:terminase small subunit [Prochlorococcus phage P-TIM68]AIR93435.1 putative terminase DNA packaging enzyme small subunit [Prochlorococcus phage P-TIM68]